MGPLLYEHEATEELIIFHSERHAVPAGEVDLSQTAGVLSHSGQLLQYMSHFMRGNTAGYLHRRLTRTLHSRYCLLASSTVIAIG